MTLSMRETFVRKILLAVAMACSMSAGAAAQTYPSGPVRFIVGYTAGASAADILARAAGQAMSASMSVPVIVDNRPGAGGTIGATAVARAKPDGHTIGVGYNSEYVIAQYFNKDIQYDPLKDFAAVGAAAQAPLGVAVSPAMGLGSMSELLAYVRNNPGKLSFGTGGVGTMPHLAVESLAQASGHSLVHVPYKGAAGAMTDLLGGQLPVMIGTLAAMAPNHETGKLKILAVVEGNRSRRLPAVPTVGESALQGYAFPATWLGFFAPAGTPPAVVKRLNTELLAALADARVRASLEAAGLEITGSTPEKLADMVVNDTQMFRKITKDAGIQPR
jgi:tripartite-type tricarboxylate transporter receptor subunit TctC